MRVQRFGFGRPQSLQRRLPGVTRPYQRSLQQGRPGTQPGSRGLAGDRLVSAMSLSPFSGNAQRAAVPPPESGLETVQRAKQQTTRLQQEDSVYEADPVLMQIRAMGRANIGQARASATAKRRQELIGFGDENFARQALGGQADDALLQAIRENAMSTTAQLRTEAARETGEAEEGFNKSNLFYGGARIRGLEELGQTQLARSASAQGAVGSRLSAIEEALMQAEQAELDRELDYLMGRQPELDDADVPPPGDGGGDADTGRPQMIPGGVPATPYRPEAVPARFLEQGFDEDALIQALLGNSGFFRRFVR